MKALINKITQTTAQSHLTVARIALGLVILPHGLQKMLGLFGGFGFQKTIEFFQQNLGIPPLFGALAILAESIGALFLILGLFGRLSALTVGFTMLTAAVMVHLQNGFFMNWFGAQKGEGVEYFVLAIALAIVTIIGGSGKLSLDQIISTKTQAA